MTILFHKIVYLINEFANGQLLSEYYVVSYSKRFPFSLLNYHRLIPIAMQTGFPFILYFTED